jgi:Protein of unknown function (DUF3618)
MTPANPTGRDLTADPAPAPSSDPQELREEIRRTREDLGDTVEALVRKVDVKARARETAVGAKQRAKDKTKAVTRSLAGKGMQLKEQVAHATAQVASRAGGKPDEVAPDQASGVVAPARVVARQRRVALLAAGGVVLVGWLVWWRKRR